MKHGTQVKDYNNAGNNFLMLFGGGNSKSMILSSSTSLDLYGGSSHRYKAKGNIVKVVLQGPWDLLRPFQGVCEVFPYQITCLREVIFSSYICLFF